MRNRRLALRFAVLGNFVPIAIATADNFNSHGTAFFIGALGACIAPVVVTCVSRRHWLPFYAAAYGGMVSVTLMQSDSGGVASGYSILVVMAMVWFGLQATDRELIAGLVVLAACAYLPMLIVGPPAYPVEWGNATLLVFVGAAVATSLRSVTRQMLRLTKRLRHEAVMDELSGVLNRRGWRESAGRELARADRTAGRVTIVVLDLDNLKEVNDSRGHDEGDRVLSETGERIRAAFRSHDIVARLGGDEFGALLTDAALDEALTAVERLRGETTPNGAFSAGIAGWDGTESLDELMRRADLALYAAKAAGGARIELAPLSLDQAESLNGA